MAQKYESDKEFTHRYGSVQCVLDSIPDIVHSDVLQPRLLRTSNSSLVQLFFAIIQPKQRNEPYCVCRQVSSISSGIQIYVWLYQE